MNYGAQGGSRGANLYGWRLPRSLPGARISPLPRRRGLLNPSVLAFFTTVGILRLTHWFDSWPVLLALGYLLWMLARGAFAYASRGLQVIMYLAIALLFFGACVTFLRWPPMWTVLGLLGVTQDGIFFKVVLVVVLLGWPAAGLFLWLRSSRHANVPTSTSLQTTQGNQQPAVKHGSFVRPPVPRVNFSDYGGFEPEKREALDLAQGRLDGSSPRNGVYLYGPPGTGKSRFGETLAGELHIPFYRVVLSELITKFPGDAENAISQEFENAARQAPIVFMLEEIDVAGSRRQSIGTGDEGGARTLFNNITTHLLTKLTDYRKVPGIIIVAATNKEDTLDEALVRDGRFDLRIRIGLPDEQGRCQILASQLRNQSCEAFSLAGIVKRTPGASAAKLQSLVDKAASIAKREQRKIRIRDLERAIEEYPRERPQFDPVQWSDLVLDEGTERELRTLVRVLSPVDFAARREVEVPTGALLTGPPGTGKGSIARLIATQTGRSFYEITSAHIFDGSASPMKRVKELFSKARNNSPSIIFLDEMDGLVPQTQFGLAQQDIQVVNQFLIEISSLQPENQVFLLGATNRRESIDPRALRGGRFTKKIETRLPDAETTKRLLSRYLGTVRLRTGLGVTDIAQRLLGIAPADLEAICGSAKMNALSRTRDNQRLAPLDESDFDQAKQSVLAVAS